MPSPIPRRQRGTFAVEFAIILMLLLVLLFGIVDLARLMYIYNTLQDTTRQAAFGASVTDYRDRNALDLLRQQAIFRTTPGGLVLGAPITDSSIQIDYLALVRNADATQTLTPIAPGDMPSCPARNRVTCAGNPNDPQCIRFIRARICDPADASACAPVHFQSLFGLFPSGAVLPTSTTIVPAETLGYSAGAATCL